MTHTAHLTSKMPVTVRFCETDLMGIVHHANYLVYFEAGRIDWLHKRGVRYEEWVSHGVHLPVVETRLAYKKSARFDETLIVATSCAAVTRVTVRYTYEITRDADLICTGETLLACVGHDLKPKRIPHHIAGILASAEVMS